MNPNPNVGIYPAGSAPTPTPPSPPLQRGKACLACRRRKIKCDGARPICTPCLRSERTEDCEYTDGPRRPRTLILEEDIARLRARVQELENPGEASPSIGLYDPYAGAASAIGPSSSSAVHARTQAPSPVSFHQPIGRRRAPTPAVSGHASPAEPNRSDFEANVQLHARRALSVITPHTAEIGFFLNPDRLRLQGTHILPALRSVITLWSIQITSAYDPNHANTLEQTSAFKSTLLSQAQSQLTSALNTLDSEPDPAVFLHVIQTGVLMAYYMQRVGQIAGARYFASGTWSLVTMLGLHRRSQGPENTNTDASMHMLGFSGCTSRLAPALDEIEAEERVRAFWAVYALDRWLGTVCPALGQSLAMDGNSGNMITVSWPGVRGMNEARSNINVVKQFLSEPNHDFTQGGASALQAKVSVLLGEVTGLVTSFLADRAIFQTPAFRTRFSTLETHLHRCSSAAIALLTSSQGPEYAQALVTIHLAGLAHVALHRPWIPTYGPSRKRCVDAALCVVRVLDQVGDVGPIGGMSPIYAIVWTALCLALHDAVVQLRARPDADPSRRHEEEEMTRAIRKLVGLLSALSQNFPSRFFASKIEALFPILESISH